MKRNLILTLLLAVFSLSSFVQAQEPAVIRGYVIDEKNGEGLPFFNVSILNMDKSPTSKGTITDEEGYFSITDVEAKQLIVQASQIGYSTAEEQINARSGQIYFIKLIVKETAVELEQFVVSAEKQEQKIATTVSVEKISAKEINSLPSMGGEPDLVQYVSVMPGVVMTGDQGGQLYIRGGSPIQNKVLMDGMTIYQPFHTIGMFSVFETDMLRSADVYTGGFNANYGGRISSVMDIQTRNGDRNKLSGKVGVTSFGARAMLEGPLKKPEELGGGYSSFIVSAKTSYLDQSSQVLYPYLEEPLPYSFTDLYAKLSFVGGEGSHFNVFGFNFDDNVNYEASTLNWDSYGAGANFRLLPSGSPLVLEGGFSYTSYEIFQSEAGIDRSSSVGSFELNLDFGYFTGDNEIKYGINVTGVSTDFDYTNAYNRVIEESQSSTELSGYFRYKMVFGKMVVDPGLRGVYYSSLNEAVLEPRLGLKYNVSDRVRIKSAMGRYTQNLISSNSDLEVVNLFSGFLASPTSLQSEFVKRDGTVRPVDSRLQKAYHIILGTEVDITNTLSANIEGYYKYYDQLISVNRYKLYEDTPEYRDIPDIQKQDYIVEDAKAYGADFSFKYDKRGISVWAVYSVAYVDRWNGVEEYFPVFDRRHNVNFTANYTFGQDMNWMVSARWNYGSGFPFTQTLGNFEENDFQGGIDEDYTQSNGNVGTVYADINQGRLPYYSRLDLSLKYNTAIGQYAELEATVGVTNATDRENMFYYNRLTNERVNQLPILPNFGMTYKF